MAGSYLFPSPMMKFSMAWKPHNWAAVFLILFSLPGYIWLTQPDFHLAPPLTFRTLLTWAEWMLSNLYHQKRGVCTSSSFVALDPCAKAENRRELWACRAESEWGGQGQMPRLAEVTPTPVSASSGPSQMVLAPLAWEVWSLDKLIKSLKRLTGKHTSWLPGSFKQSWGLIWIYDLPPWKIPHVFPLRYSLQAFTDRYAVKWLTYFTYM